MTRVAFILGALLLVIIGGGLTAQIAQQGGDAIPVFVIQTENPDASVFDSTPWKAEQLVLLVGFLLFNLIGIGLTIALIMWFLSRGVKSVQGGAEEKPVAAAEPEAAESA